MELVELSTDSRLFETSTANNATSTDNEDALPMWLMVFNKIQLFLTITGALNVCKHYTAAHSICHGGTKG